MTLAQAVKNRFDVLVAARRTEESLWDEIRNYVLPERASFTESAANVTGTQQQTRRWYVMDSTAGRAAEVGASNIFHHLANPANPWFDLSVGDGSQDKDTAVASWRKASVKRVMDYLTLDMETMIYGQLFASYLDVFVFGTSVLLTEDVNGRPVVQSLCLRDTYLDEGYNGTVDSLYRRIRRTPRQILQRWPNADVTEMKTAEGKSTEEIIQCIFPVSDQYLAAQVPDAVKARAKARGASHYIVYSLCSKNLVLEAGYAVEQPFAVSRWYVTSESVYGRAAGATNLPDIRLANQATGTYLRQQAKLADPPMLLQYGQMITPLRLFPGAISYSDMPIEPNFLIPPGGSRIEFSEGLIERKQRDIQRGFFTPLFLDVDGAVKTATQVLAETDDRNRAIAPMLIRLQQEQMRPFLRRVIGIMLRSQMIPRPPIDGEVRILFNAPIVGSQRVTEALNTMRLFEGLAAWGQIDQSAFDHADVDAVIPILREGFGAPPEVLLRGTAMQAKRRERQDAQQQMINQERAIAGAEAQAKLMAARR